jgi:hypothetical protein
LAVVLDVGHEPAAQEQAIRTQQKLLDCCGTRLDSIRLAAPRLLSHACRAALAEEPGMLVMVGGPRAARGAGQLAYERGTPILFLPGSRAPVWARRLWGGLSLDEMISALARGEMTPTRLNAGTAGGQIFFDHASCGLLPLIGELRQALAEADIFPEVWKTLLRGAGLARLVVHPRIRFRSADSPPRSASALVVSPATREWREGQTPALTCQAWKHSVFGQLGALVGGSFGANWRRDPVERFACAQLAIDGKRATWLLLDGVPRRFDGPVELECIPDAIRTFAFNPREAANDYSLRRLPPANARRRTTSQGTFGRALTLPTSRPARAR